MLPAFTALRCNALYVTVKKGATMRLRFAPLYFVLVLFAVMARADESTQRSAINTLLDGFHQAAADGDEKRYLGYFAENGVFMGTDDWERWPLEAFREYVHERFSTGGGWTYVSEERFVTFSANGDTAWFDEVMVSARWGRFRGTGVLTKHADAWKIAHYSLTALVPNERFEDISEIANQGFDDRKDAQ